MTIPVSEIKLQYDYASIGIISGCYNCGPLLWTMSEIQNLVMISCWIQIRSRCSKGQSSENLIPFFNTWIGLG
jgi:hypothetical protein